MKKYKNLKQFLKTVVLFITVATLFCCNKDNNDCQGIDCLPAATQTGAGTFGCLVNGEPYVDTSGNFNCFYQFVDGEYYFGIDGTDVVKDLNSIILSTNNQQLLQGQIYPLLNNSSGNTYGGCGFFIRNTSYDLSLTDENYTGELTITKFDLQNRIVSGTFWFNIQNPYTGETVKITEGRFDTHFGQ